MLRVRVLIDHEACSAFDRVTETCSGQPETGGVLLGCLRGADIEVTTWTSPGPTDHRSLFTFARSDRLHQETAHRLWNESGGTQTWVGEWHSHPYGEVQPSSIDLNTWRQHVRVERRPMVFVLAAPREWGLFVVSPRILRTKATRLSLVENGVTGRVFA